MVALWIVGILLLLILVLLLLRVGVRLQFGEVLRVTAIAGPIRLQLVPEPEKKKTDKPKKEKAPKKKKEKTPEAGEKKRSLGLTFHDIRSALPALWESLKRGLRKTRQRLRIDPMRLSVCFGGDDPAQVAELYGWANTAMWTVMPEMERLTRMPDPHIHLETDFTCWPSALPSPGLRCGGTGRSARKRASRRRRRQRKRSRRRIRRIRRPPVRTRPHNESEKERTAWK